MRETLKGEKMNAKLLQELRFYRIFRSAFLWENKTDWILIGLFDENGLFNRRALKLIDKDWVIK